MRDGREYHQKNPRRARPGAPTRVLPKKAPGKHDKLTPNVWGRYSSSRALRLSCFCSVCSGYRRFAFGELSLTLRRNIVGKLSEPVGKQDLRSIQHQRRRWIATRVGWMIKTWSATPLLIFASPFLTRKTANFTSRTMRWKMVCKRPDQSSASSQPTFVWA